MLVDTLITLAKVLLNIDDLPWEYALYIPSSNVVWSEDMGCMVLDPEDSADPDDDPDTAKKNGLKYGLMISDVQDVVENLKAQKSDADLDLKIKSLKHYYENNAFITIV